MTVNTKLMHVIADGFLSEYGEEATERLEDGRRARER